MFGTMIAHGVQMTTKISDPLSDLGIKGQGQTYCNSVWLVTLCQRVFMFGTMIAYAV